MTEKALGVSTKTLLAISNEIDGALADIRKARVDIEAIAGDVELRNALKNFRDKG